MTLIEKIERALALAKDLGLNDNQTQELMALVLNMPITRITFTNPPIMPYSAPNTTPQWPGGHEIICTTPSWPNQCINIPFDCSGVASVNASHMAILDACGLNNFGSCNPVVSC